jgi:hypothetical protein
MMLDQRVERRIIKATQHLPRPEERSEGCFLIQEIKLIITNRARILSIVTLRAAGTEREHRTKRLTSTLKIVQEVLKIAQGLEGNRDIVMIIDYADGMSEGYSEEKGCQRLTPLKD